MRKINSHKLFFFVVMLFAGIFRVYGVDEHFYGSKEGIHFTTGSSLTVQDDKFGTSLWSTIQKNIKVTDVVTFELDEDTAFFLIGRHKCRVDLEITYYNALGVVDSLATTLSINYDSTRSKRFNFRSSFKFNGGYKVKARVLAVFYDNILTINFPKVFRLREDIYINRIYYFDCSAPMLPMHSFDATNQRLEIDWTHFTGAQEYDLEYTFYDSLSYVVRNDMGNSYTDFGFLFNGNATRVTIQGCEYAFSLVYNPGHVFYRIRPIHYDSVGNRIEGTWSSDTSCTLANYANQFIWKGHENSLNWQYTAAFAEQGKRKEVTSYFDGSLRNRQSVTLNNTQNKAIVGETMYDYQGRPAVTTLPAPLDSGKIVFYDKYNVDLLDSEYNKKDFDTGACGYVPVGMDSLLGGTARGSFGYYSSANPDRNSGFDAFLPDAEGYPFTMTEYTPDNTGRISRQSIAGKTHRLGSGHETKYFYGKPAQEELDRLFGSEAGNNSHYLKNMVMDANGQVSVSYVDANGKTVATALAGQLPSNMQPIGSYAASTTMDVSLLDNDSIHPSNTSTFSGYSLLATNAGEYHFAYRLLPSNYSDSSCSSAHVCTDCLYDVQLMITNSCGCDSALVMHYDSNFSYTSAFDTLCGHHNILDTFTIFLQPGQYNISRLITVDPKAIGFYTAEYKRKATCLKTYSTFLTSAIASTDFTGCNMTCASCFTALGPESLFVSKYITELHNGGESVSTHQDTLNADSAWTSAYAQCSALCGNTSPCSSLYTEMFNDVSLGGQYCKDTLIGGVYSPYDATSMLNSSFYKSPNPAYVDASGKLDSVNINGVKYAPQTLSVTDFVQNWKPSWASSLVKYHPEYCYYTYCNSDSASNRWDNNFEGTTTFAAACSAGYLEPLGIMPSGCSCSASNPDPYFKKLGLGQADSTLMRKAMMYYTSHSSTKISLWASIALAVNKQEDTLKGMTITTTFNPSDTVFCSGCTGSFNMEWTMFQGIYLSMKRHIQDSLENIYVEGCGSFANCVGQSGCGNYGPPKIARNINTLNASQYAVGPKNPTPASELHYADSVITASCDSNCLSFATYWYQRLDSCGTVLKTDSIPLMQGLLAVCEAGCNPSHPFGASTTPNSAPDANGDISFEDVIHRVLGVTYTDTFCNGTVINMPPPYYDSVGTTGPTVTYYKPTPCQCGNIDSAYSLYSKDSIHDLAKYKNFGEFLSKYYGDSISETNAWLIHGLCTGTCFYASTPIQMPLWLSCCQADMQPQQVTNPSGLIWATKDTLPIDSGHSALDGLAFDVGFSIGKCGYVGGGENARGHNYSFWKWSQVTNTWSSITDFPDTAAVVGDVAFSINGKGYVGLGYNGNSDKSDSNFYSYDTATNTWDTIRPFPDSARISAFAFVIGDTAYVGAGADTAWGIFTHSTTEGAYYTHFYAYDPHTNKWFRRADFPGSGRTAMAAFSVGQYGYAGCGYGRSPSGTYSDQYHDMWRFNPSTDSWDTVRRIPTDTGFTGALGFSINGNGFVGQGMYVQNATGLSIGGVLKSTFWQYNPLTTQWIRLQAANTPSPRIFGAGFVIGNKAYYGTGERKFNADNMTRFNDLHQLGLDTVNAKYANPECCISCVNIDTAINHFKKAYPVVNDSSSSYPTMLTTYLNQYFSFDMTFTEYQQFYKECTSGDSITLGDSKHLALLLCNRANNEAPPITDTNPCYTNLMLDAQYNAQAAYNSYLDSVQNTFEANYVKHCMQIDDSFHVTMPFDEYHYTLYYYDQAENLLKTVPPQGVHPITAQASLDSVTYYRAGKAGYTKPVYPIDSMQTRYFYNTLNSPIKQQTPDGDSVHFWYDRLGRIVLSQNATQRPLTYAYTSYDALGRVVEVGQLSDVPANLPSCFHCVGCTISYGVLPVLPDTFTRNDAELINFIYNSTRTQVTHTYYDSVTYSNIPLVQQNLRKRIASITYEEKNDYNIKTYDNAIHYTYDIEGNVASIIIDVPHDSIVKQRYKRINYYYDLVSGNVNEFIYEQDSIDQFIHSYEYDADNRMTAAMTSQDSLYWENDIEYEYYDHNPLAREILGRRQVQGTDYVYTINGWIKGVNSSITNPSYDIGHDGDVHSNNSTIARDAYGYTLNYYTGDYRSIATTNFAAAGLPITSLYNANVAGATYSIKPLNPKTIGYEFTYDQLNRYLGDTIFKNPDTVNNNWTTRTGINDFKEKVTYNEDGSPLTYLRHGNTMNGGHLAMDSLNYYYNKNTNQTNYITDAVPNGNYSNDIHNENKNNYKYNGIGELAKDSVGGIDTITWTVYNKIKKIKKHNGDSIVFFYDPIGHILEKRYYPHSATSDTTKYVRDAKGNILAIYDRKKDTVRLTEWDIYGFNRIGSIDTTMRMQKPKTGVGTIDSLTLSYLEGQKQYELTNYLSNVLVTVSDKKIPVDTVSTDTLAKYYLPNIVSSQDYYPYGMLMPGRQYLLTNSYNYGFNGKFREDTVYGAGNFYDYGLRMYYDRAPFFPSVDPLAKQFPYFSPYIFSGDNPIENNDLDGKETSPQTYNDEGVVVYMQGTQTPTPAPQQSTVQPATNQQSTAQSGPLAPSSDNNCWGCGLQNWENSYLFGSNTPTNTPGVNVHGDASTSKDSPGTATNSNHVVSFDYSGFMGIMGTVNVGAAGSPEPTNVVDLGQSLVDQKVDEMHDKTHPPAKDAAGQQSNAVSSAPADATKSQKPDSVGITIFPELGDTAINYFGKDNTVDSSVVKDSNETHYYNTKKPLDQTKGGAGVTVPRPTKTDNTDKK